MPQNQKKRLFINLDGTGQSEYTLKALKTEQGGFPTLTSPAVTNIARIGRALVTDDEVDGFQQIVYYLAGVGSSSEDSWVAKNYQGLTGTGLLQNVREAYGFLCNNYDYEDEIYITGFSRGAFTARSIAGMVGSVGILTKKGLEHFYEAFDYYENTKKWTAAGKECPVSPEAGTTRKNNPETNERITIKAVGVFDTVGALSGDFAFHNVSFDGDHIEHGFHALSLDEKRGYFSPTMWESKEPRDYSQFEQCWMVGDHSNVGGSWENQQLADISLAWMMSRYETLGAKFNQSYLYDEFVKNKRYFEGKSKGPNKPEVRQWGEGKCKEIKPYRTETLLGGTAIRAPRMYRQKMKTDWWLQTLPDSSGPLLKNTNETIHPSVRYRHFCKNCERLGIEDQGCYDPKALADWNWPRVLKDAKASFAEMKYSKKSDNAVTIRESPMGRHEQILLALHDQTYPANNGQGVWERVVGGKPPQEILEHIAGLKTSRP